MILLKAMRILYIPLLLLFKAGLAHSEMGTFLKRILVFEYMYANICTHNFFFIYTWKIELPLYDTENLVQF